MEWLVVLHVLAAIIGIGPTYFGSVLYREGQSVGQLKHAVAIGQKLDLFPKIGGTIAVLTGIWLVAATGHAFGDFWIWASLALYVAIQIVVVGILLPASKPLIAWLQETKAREDEPLPQAQSAALRKINRLHAAAMTMGTLLFILMILKPLL